MLGGLGGGEAHGGVRGEEELLKNGSGGCSADEGQGGIVAVDGGRRLRAEGAEEARLFSRKRKGFVAQAGGPGEGVVVADRVVAAVGEFVELPMDEMVAFGFEARIGVADAGEMVVEVATAEGEVEFGGLVDEVDGLIHFGGHEPRAPAVTDGRGAELGMGHGELHRDFGAFALAEHVDPAGVDGGIGLHGPSDEFFDGLVVGGTKLAGLGRDGEQDELIGETQPEQALADGEDVVAGGGVMLLGAEDEAELRRGVGRGLDDVFRDGLAGGVFELQFGFQRGEGAGEEEENGESSLDHAVVPLLCFAFECFLRLALDFRAWKARSADKIQPMKTIAIFLTLVCTGLVLSQTVQVPSPKQGRAGEILPTTRFRPRTAPYEPTAEEKQAIAGKLAALDAEIAALRAKGIADDLLVDVEIFAEAARWVLRFPEEFFRKESVASTLAVMEMGSARAALLQRGQSPWTTQKGRLIRGYRSAVDGSVQPYRLTVPEEYDGTRAFPLDVIEHGRYVTRYEVEFINAFERRGADRPYLPGTIQIELHGRGNNAFHWPGEADVFEGIAAVSKAYKIDKDRVALRGFSMGGAGVWHTALHHPGEWASVEAGAGDTESHRMRLVTDLAPHQQAMCRIFDNTYEWMLNAFNMPFIGYVGEIDGSFAKHVVARRQLTQEGFHFEGESFTTGLRVKEVPSIVFLVAPNTPHATDPEFRKRMDAMHLENLKKGRVSPDHLRFLTYTTRYNRSHWATLDGLEKHYERAEIEAKRMGNRSRYEIKTKNLTRLTLRETERAATVVIDGQTLAVTGAAELVLAKTGGKWEVTRGAEAGLRKRHGLQGPIDDAFLEPFLIVKPTGTPWNPAAQEQALAILARFDRQYQLAYRGQLRVKDDRDVTAADFEKYHVVLFGDPGSNRWIERVAAKLPLTWGRETVAMGGQRFPAGEVLPAMIYPNPLNPRKYVVLNSGLTALWEDWAGDFPTPQYGDYAILRTGTKEDPDVAMAGVFDEGWKVQPERK